MSFEHIDVIISFAAILAGVSLIVTTLTQLVSATLGLRGTNLRWGLTTLLREIDPSLEAYAATISEKVLNHSLISDSSLSRFGRAIPKRWRLASSIRTDELVAVLGMLAEQATPPVSVNPPEPWAAALNRSMQTLVPQSAIDLEAAAPALRGLLPDDTNQANRVVRLLLTANTQLSEDLGRWFGSVMDRVSQRFTLHMRVWTVVFSVIVAFIMHLDAFQLFSRLSSDGELRSRILSSSDALLREAGETLAPTEAKSGEEYLAAMRRMIEDHRDELQRIGEPSGFKDLTGAKEWLAKHLDSAGIADSVTWLRFFEHEFQQNRVQTSAEKLLSMIHERLQLQIVPDPYPQPFYNYWTPTWAHFWGIAATVALLSLGAPFWFNILKSLTNLRPVIARRVDAETTETKGDS